MPTCLVAFLQWFHQKCSVLTQVVMKYTASAYGPTTELAQMKAVFILIFFLYVILWSFGLMIVIGRDWRRRWSYIRRKDNRIMPIGILIIQKGISIIQKGTSGVQKGMSEIEKGTSEIQKGTSIIPFCMKLIEKGLNSE